MKAALEGLRVVDLSRWWAGPALTELLGNMGAEVIKVEAVRSIDPWRTGGARLSAEQADGMPSYELSPVFNAVNRNKLGVTLDLKHPRGAALLKELAGRSDLLVENYSPGVLPRLGLGYESLREARPDLVMISMPAFGGTGPMRDHLGFAYPTEQSAGAPHLTGYAGEDPMLWGPAGADAVAGMFGAVAVLAALEYRRRTGEGQHIDLSQVEAVSTFYGEQMIDYVWNGRLPERIGNRDRRHAPHGCYRALGDDSWIVVAVTDDPEWRALCNVLGRDDWRGRGDLASADGRREQQDELDAGIEAWTSARENSAAAALLQEAGVPAAPVLSGADLFRDDHLRARGFVQELEREWIGKREYTGMWAAFSETPGTLRSPAPLLGEHNREVLGGLLGLGDDELADLEAEAVIGTVPVADG